ncbi:MAG: transcriptional regulator [Nocardiaceae bacterium]|nr:transcriptional regulator [Nocardiaceae bacterium]
MSRRGLRGFDPSTFAAARRAAGYTLSELGRIADIGLTTLHNWENGSSPKPQVEALARAVAALGVTMADVIDIPPNRRTVADLRALAGLTQPQLAANAGISTAAMSQIERAAVRLTPDKARALAKALSITEAELTAAYQRARSRPAGSPP